MSALATAAASAFAAQSKSVFSDENLALYSGNLSAATFEPWVETEFDLTAPNGATNKLQLISVRDLSTLAPTTGGSGPAKGSLPVKRVTGFMLSFQGTGAALPQNTYILSNTGLGSFAAFLVPAGSGQPKYTAVFATAPQGA